MAITARVMIKFFKSISLFLFSASEGGYTRKQSASQLWITPTATKKKKKNLLPVLHLSTSLTLTFFSFFYYYLIPLCTTFLHFICKPEEYKTFIGHKTSFSSSLSDGMRERKKREGKDNKSTQHQLNTTPPITPLLIQVPNATL